MGRSGLKKLLGAGVVIFALGLGAAEKKAWSWCGGLGFGAGAYNASGWATWCGPRCHHGFNGYGCGYGCGYGYGYGYGCSSCYDPCGTCSYCGTSVVGSCGCGTFIAPATGADGVPSLSPAASPTPSTTAPAPPAGSPHTSIEPPSADSGVLTVWVPNEAKVLINGLTTRSTGSTRSYVSYGLTPGHTYMYKIKAEVVREGKTITEEQTVLLRAGAQRNVVFGSSTPSVEGLATTR